MHKRILKLAVIFVLIFSWIFGYPPLYENSWRAEIWQNPQIPPKIQEALAVCESSPCSYTTVGSDTFTVPAYDELTVTMWGGGGGGGGAGSASTDGQTGGQSSFDSPTLLIANGGSGGSKSNTPGVGGAGGAGGTASGGDTNTTGNSGVVGADKAIIGGAGGDAPNGGTGGAGGSDANGSPGGIPGAGAGGGGYKAGGSKYAAGGGGSGGYTTKTFTAGQLTGSINVVVGGGETGGSGDTSGGSGARGQIDISWTVPGLSTAIEIRGQDYSTAVTNITFPAGDPSAVISNPSNGTNTQVFGDAGIAKPVVTLYNGNGAPLTIWYNMSVWTDAVSTEHYLINDKGAACANADAVSNLAVFDTDTKSAGSTQITNGVGNEKDLYLKVTLGASWGKDGESTLTILGET